MEFHGNKEIPGNSGLRESREFPNALIYGLQITFLADSVHTLIFLPIELSVTCVGIILLVEFSIYLERFSTIWSGISYIRHKQFGLLFIESPFILCTLPFNNSANISNCLLKEIFGLCRFAVFPDLTATISHTCIFISLTDRITNLLSFEAK